MVFHGFRVSKDGTHLEWSPHYHSLAVFKYGYACRECAHAGECGDFPNCEGFENVTRKFYASDGCIVKVAKGYEKRHSVVGSGWYLLNHSTICEGVHHSPTITWFGNCANTKFKSPEASAEDKCEVCGEDMLDCHHVGSRVIITDVTNPYYVPVFLDSEFDEDGNENYIEKGCGRFGVEDGNENYVEERDARERARRFGG